MIPVVSFVASFRERNSSSAKNRVQGRGSRGFLSRGRGKEDLRWGKAKVKKLRLLIEENDWNGSRGNKSCL